MSQIGVSYTPSTGSPYSFLFSEFSGSELSRTYNNLIAFKASANGASILTGPAFTQKYIWAISTVILTTTAESFDEMFKDWDIDRSNGLAAAVGITDTTFGTTVDTSAVFSTAPSYSRLGPKYTSLSFGLTEI
jgi:hypothetical protein